MYIDEVETEAAARAHHLMRNLPQPQQLAS